MKKVTTTTATMKQRTTEIEKREQPTQMHSAIVCLPYRVLYDCELCICVRSEQTCCVCGGVSE